MSLTVMWIWRDHCSDNESHLTQRRADVELDVCLAFL